MVGAQLNGIASCGFSGIIELPVAPILDLELFQTLTNAMAENANSFEKLQTVMGTLTKRATCLDTALNATRLDSP